MTPALCDDLIGIPFEHAGRVPFEGVATLARGRGIDCYGVLLECYRRQGVTIPDPFVTVMKDWATREADGVPGDWIATHLSGWRRLPEPVAGCAVAFSKGGRVADHVGVMVSSYQFIHAAERTGVVLARIDRVPWSHMIVGFYDYRP